MRLAGHTYTFRDRPLEAALDELAAVGLEEVEIWLGHVREPGDAAAAVSARDLRVVAVSAGGFYIDDAAAVTKAFSVADRLESPVLVACVLPHLLAQVVGAAPDHIRLCVENHWYQPVATPAEVKAALAQEPSAGACLDTGHALLAGVAPGRFITTLGERVGHVHLKDDRRPPWPQLLLGRKLRHRLLPRPPVVGPGTGDLDIVALMQALRAERYSGAISLEYEGAQPEAALALLIASARSAIATQGSAT